MDNSKKPDKKNPRKNVSFLSQLLFLWFIPVLWKGRKYGINTDDLTVCLKKDQSNELGDKLEREWNKQYQKTSDKNNRKRLLRKVIFLTFYPSIILDGLLIFIYILIRTMTPLVLGQLLLQFQKPLNISTLIIQSTNSSVLDGNVNDDVVMMIDSKSNEDFLSNFFEYIWNDKFYLSIIMILLLTCGAFLFHHTDLRERWIGARIRISCCSLIYRKTLRLSKKSSGQTGAGYLINLLSNDVSRFDNGFRLIHYIWILPIQSALICYLLWRQIGLPGIIGVALLLIQTVPVTPALSRLSSVLRGKVAIRSGKRIGIMNEIIQGIQIIKMYAWEKPFTVIVNQMRQSEMKQIRWAAYVRTLSLVTKLFTARITLFITIFIIVINNEQISAHIVYSMGQYFQYLELTVAVYYSQALFFGAEALVAIDRIQDYLLFEEKTDTVYGYKQIECNRNLSNTKKTNPQENYSIELNKLSAAWNSESIASELTLNNITLNVKPGQLCAIVGSVGCGKSSLLQLLMGELPILSGNCLIRGNISYASQEPWLFSDTIRNNILFGEPYNSEWYSKVIECCALQTDLKLFDAGDHTIVGERGSMLSGGQRARISLARAIYKLADIYLLDDPLSAVDVHVGKYLFDNVIGSKGCLATNNRDGITVTRFLVTHQVHFLKSADIIVVIENGKIIQQGTYEELVANGNIDLNLTSTEKPSNSQDKIITDTSLINNNDVILDNDYGDDDEEVPFYNYHNNIINPEELKNIPYIDGYRNSDDDDDGEDEEEEVNEQDYDNEKYSVLIKPTSVLHKARPVSIISTSKKSLHKSMEFEGGMNRPKQKTESQAGGHISLNVWKRYFQSGGSVLLLILLALLLIVSQIIISGTDYFLNYWTQKEFLRQNHEHVAISTVDYLKIYTILITLLVSFCFIRCLLFLNVFMRASNNLHNQMFVNLLNAPMQFFNENPPGRILNRFSKDMGAIDELVPRAMLETIQVLLLICGILTLVAVVNPIMILTLIIAIIFYVLVLKLNLKASQDLKRLEGITKSPVFSYLSTTITGLSTIRVRNLQIKMIKEFDCLQNVHSAIFQLTTVSTTCLGLWLDIISTAFAACVTFSFMSLQNSTFSGNVGLALTQAISLTGVVQYGIKQIAETIQQMISTERVLEYSNLETEKSPNKVPTIQWPEMGKIQFNNMSLRYDKNSPPVLRNIQICIEANWKIGIVGRTGAGKSSLINALFRLSPIDGEILIDGLDTGHISLESLRTKISIIPQDPFLFSATVRYNLDPFGVYDDFQLWKALENVELKKSTSSLDNMITEGGSNFSVGQRQLMCLARALLRQNKILVLDEATANVDPQTDELIQRTIRTNFKECTSLMIAHRLHTVIDADRIVVMDKGEVKEFDIPYLLLEDRQSLLWEMINATGPQESQYLKNIAHEKYLQIKEIQN